jgi:hypothetical protein
MLGLGVAAPGSRVKRLPERPPLLPEVLDNLACLLMADLDQFRSQVAALPLDDRGSMCPAEVLPQALIGLAVVVLKPSDEPVRVVDRAVIRNDRIVGDLGSVRRP